MARRLPIPSAASEPHPHARAATLQRDVPFSPPVSAVGGNHMKLDRTTAVLATLALCSIGFAQRAFGQSTVNCSNPQIGTDVLLGTTAASSACQVSNTVQVTLGKYARLSIDNTTTNLTVPQASDFGTAAGVNTTGPNLTVSSNAPWTLT